MNKRLFHYTTGNNITQITKDGIINVETGGSTKFNGQQRAVWCTFSEEWEETCNKGLISDGKSRLLSKMETAQYAGGLYRIEVEKSASPNNWEDWLNLSNVDNRMARGLEKVAKERGSNIDLWRVSFDPIPKKLWVSIEAYRINKKEWVRDEVLSWLIS